jgi:arginase
MPVSVIAGRCWQRWREGIDGFHVVPENRIVQVGLHDRSFEDDPTGPAYGIGTLVDPRAVAEHGFEAAFAVAVTIMREETDRVHVHIDSDVIDARFLRGNRHAAVGGPTPDQLVWAVGEIARSLRITSVSLSCYDTAVDPRGPEVLVPLMCAIAQAATSS